MVETCDIDIKCSGLAHYISLYNALPHTMKDVTEVPPEILAFMSAKRDVRAKSFSRKVHHETTYGILQTE